MSKPVGSEQNQSARRTFTIERVHRALLTDVWNLWTTKDGIESWWGPGGFSVTVRHLDLRPGGQLHYLMTAVDPQQVEFMRAEGMALTTDVHVTYTDVVPLKRLAYENTVNFVPGVAPYLVAHAVDLQQLPKGRVRMTLTIDAMHDDEWTERTVAGFESQLDKLRVLLQSRTVNDRA